jgi:hypothetical protein
MFDPRLSLGDSTVDTIGIRRETAIRRCLVWNAFYTLRHCPALVCVFSDISIPKSEKTKAVAIRREAPPGFPLVWPGITDQSRGKDLSDRAGRSLPQVRSLGKGLSEHLDRTYS